jgi:hypothetical protein
VINLPELGVGTVAGCVECDVAPVDDLLMEIERDPTAIF